MRRVERGVRSGRADGGPDDARDTTALDRRAVIARDARTLRRADRRPDQPAHASAEHRSADRADPADHRVHAARC